MSPFLHTSLEERAALNTIVSRQRKKMNRIRFSLLGLIGLIMFINFHFLIYPQYTLIFSVIGIVIVFIATMVPKLSADVSGEVTELEGTLKIHATNISKGGPSSSFYVNDVEVMLPKEWLAIMRRHKKSYSGTFRYIQDDNPVAYLVSMNINDRKLSIYHSLQSGRKSTMIATIAQSYFKTLRP